MGTALALTPAPGRGTIIPFGVITHCPCCPGTTLSVTQETVCGCPCANESIGTTSHKVAAAQQDKETVFISVGKRIIEPLFGVKTWRLEHEQENVGTLRASDFPSAKDGD
jgi:hypothetical protein